MDVQGPDDAFDAIGGQFGRTSIVAWLMRIADEQNVSEECTFLALSYLEGYLIKRPVSFSVVQNFAGACLILACKMVYREFRPRLAITFPRLRANLFTELSTLDTLQWQLVRPTAYTFLQLLGWRFQLPSRDNACAVHRLKQMIFCKLESYR